MKDTYDEDAVAVLTGRGREFTLQHWRVVSIDDGFYHLAGFVVETGKWRVPAHVQSFNWTKSLGQVATKNRYRLVGPRGYQAEIIAAIDDWLDESRFVATNRDCDPLVLPR